MILMRAPPYPQLTTILQSPLTRHPTRVLFFMHIRSEQDRASRTKDILALGKEIGQVKTHQRDIVQR